MSRQFLFKFLFSILSVAFVVVVVLLIVQLINLRNQDGSSGPGERVTDSLKFVIVMSRHGNRGAHEDYPGDPYPINDTQYWPFGNDGLTPVGRKQMYKLGGRVRGLYNGFLNSSFYPEELHASSTYMDRMLMSGECFLAGLYPPRSWQLWDSALPWQPTPLYSDSPDNTVRIMKCSRFLAELVMGVVHYLNKSSNMAAIKEQLLLYDEATGCDSCDFTDLFVLWDKLISEETEGYALPPWTTRLYPEPLINLVSDLYMQTFAGSDEIIRLLVGNLYGEIREALMEKAEGRMPAGRRLLYYSGHDSTLLALQALLGVPLASLQRLVKPSSSLVLELHQHPVSGEYGVQLLYIDGGSADLELSHLPLSGCEEREVCPLPYLLNRTTKITRVNFTEECKVDGPNFQAADALRKFKRFIYKYTH